MNISDQAAEAAQREVRPENVLLLGKYTVRMLQCRLGDLLEAPSVLQSKTSP